MGGTTSPLMIRILQSSTHPQAPGIDRLRMRWIMEALTYLRKIRMRLRRSILLVCSTSLWILNLLNFYLHSGVAIYFLSPLWPYPVNTAVSLDSGPIFLIDLVDHSSPTSPVQGPETEQSQVVWNATGLENGSHRLVISVGAGQPFAIVDGLMYDHPRSLSCAFN